MRLGIGVEHALAGSRHGPNLETPVGAGRGDLLRQGGVAPIGHAQRNVGPRAGQAVTVGVREPAGQRRAGLELHVERSRLPADSHRGRQISRLVLGYQGERERVAELKLPIPGNLEAALFVRNGLLAPGAHDPDPRAGDR